MNKIFLCLELISILICIHAGSFRHEHFAVYFSPFVSRHDTILDAYTEPELVFMVEKIATRFSRIMMPYINEDYATRQGEEYSLVKIPKAVAKFNKKSKQSVELIMLYSMGSVTGDGKLNIEFVKQKADEANTLFPGTVKLIMMKIFEADLYTDPEFVQDLYDTLAYSKSVLASTPNIPFNYTLGAILPDNSYRHTLESHVPELFSDLEIVLYEFDTAYVNVGSEILSSVSKLEQAFKIVERDTLAIVRKNIEVGFVLRWPDTFDGAQSISNLVSVWESIGNWSRKTNVTVVMQQAFDEPTNKEPSLRTAGWWRLIESGEYKDAKDYIFEEKKLVINQQGGNKSEGMKWLTKYFLKDTTSGNFNRDKLAVTFHPYSDNLDFGKQTPESNIILSQIKLISSEFSQILIDPYPLYESDFSSVTRFGEFNNYLNNSQNVGLVSKVVAQFNQNLNALAVQLVMVFPCNECSSTTFNQTDVGREFDEMKQLADEANSVFPASVQTFLLKFDQIKYVTTWYNASKFGVELEYTRWRLGEEEQEEYSRGSPYKLGVLLPISDCDQNSRFTLSLSVPEWVKLLVFRVVPTRQDLSLGVESSIGGYFRLFQFCIEKISNISKDAEVGFMMTWPERDADGIGSIAHLVEFWGKVNIWAGRTNTTIFMEEAFDSSFRGNPFYASRGWWRRVKDNRSDGDLPEGVVYEDKKSVLLRQIAKERTPLGGDYNYNDQQRDSKMITTITGFVLGSATVVVLVGMGLYTKFFKRKDSLLTKEEIEQFFNGDGSCLVDVPGLEGIPNVAYQNKELECNKDGFIIEEDKILGSGQFGIVFQAKVNKRGEDGELVDVAAKTTKIPFSLASVRGILAEIKILSYLGSHEHIVSIVGAYTAELAQGKIFIFTELCMLGSLKDNLRKIKPAKTISAPVTELEEDMSFSETDNLGYVYHSEFEDLNFGSADDDPDSSPITDPLIILEMSKWAYEISCGMEFLAAKHVVHADLATRNVLLTESRTAKISDFGLSRRLYAYESYVKKQKEDLPWRWMAPESLRKFEFNEKTDVWSFGVTLWEIFSLAEIPFGGLNCNANFIRELENVAERLAKPHYDNLNLYSLMMECWNVDPGQRPRFSELKVRLASRLSQYSKLGVVQETVF